MTNKQVRFEELVLDVREWEALGEGWREELESERRRLRASFDPAEYERKDLAWYRTAYLEYFLFVFDKRFYDPQRGRYTIEEVVDQGVAEYGGFDFVMLWHGYPRLGVDERNQFDILDDLPGGLEGLRGVVDRLHSRGVRVVLPYTPWDTATRRDSGSDAENLARVVAALDLDGLCLDTMNAARPELRRAIDRARPGVVFAPENLPPTMELAQITTGSDLTYERRLNHTPGDWFGGNFMKIGDLPKKLLIIKWLEPRYSVRGNMGHVPGYQYQAPVVANSFFHGMGHQAVDNLFGWWIPFSAEAKTTARRCTRLLRAHSDAFLDPGWQPYVQTLRPGVFAHRWSAGEKTVYTLFNNTPGVVEGNVIRVECSSAMAIYDAWNGGRATVTPHADGTATVSLCLDPLCVGCLVVQPREWRPPVDAAVDPVPDTPWCRASIPQDHLPRPVLRSAPALAAEVPPEMVRVEGGRFVMRIRMNLSAPEGGCYSHPDRHGHPDRLLQMQSILVDRTEVTNQAYRAFLAASRYRPRELRNFLKTWVRPSGEDSDPWEWRIPEGLENHPVVHVDLEDARAHARWAGKRLPTEEEWQYAAQGADGRTWPWGSEFDRTRCNGADGSLGWGEDGGFCPGATTPVDAHPGGASPWGCLDMCGNVWEWTESERDDGHTRYAMLKGGSYFRAGGTRWYLAGGAQPCDAHVKLLLMWPGLDRSTTVGFRCVKDIAEGGLA